MKKTILILFLFISGISNAQNLQPHYASGHAGDIKRNYFTATFELVKADALGSTFMFADFDFSKDNGGAFMAYGEIVRKFTLNKKSGFALQLEYDDGTPDYITPAFLGGFSYPVKLGKFTLNASLLYKAYYKAKSPDGQVTLVWNHMLFNSKVLLSGFIDLWSQDKIGTSGKTIVFLSEPQIWYLLNRQLKLGSELELSRNFFVFDNRFKFMP